MAILWLIKACVLAAWPCVHRCEGIWCDWLHVPGQVPYLQRLQCPVGPVP